MLDMQFIQEEKYGWQVKRSAPNALRVIDTQDLHWLRRVRQEMVQETHSKWQVCECGWSF